jgi:hypothetical protein
MTLIATSHDQPIILMTHKMNLRVALCMFTSVLELCHGCFSYDTKYG